MAENNDVLNFLLNVSTNIFLELDSQGKILYASSKAKYIFNSDKLVGNSVIPLLDAANRDLLISKLKTVIYENNADSFSMEFNERFYNVFIYPYQKFGVVCWEDVTERLQLSQVLDKTKRRLDFAERTANMGYWELDLKIKKFYWSAEMFRIFGLEAKNISHKKNIIREHILAEDLPIYKEKISNLLKNNKAVEGRVRIIREDGNIAYCQFRASIIFDNGLERIAGTFQDITPLAETEIALENAKEEADRLNLAKSYFLAQASHDLRQPMQALNMFIAALGSDKLSNSQHCLVDKIEASANSLKSLLDNLLDISKLDSGGMVYSSQRFNLGRFLGQLCGEYDEVAYHQHLKFRYRLPAIMLESDALLLERIIRNLLSNAFKYAKSKVLLTVKQVMGGVKITIFDDGAGISEEEQSLIFEEFYQSKKVLENRRLGAGLGLSIVQKIAKILGAKVRVVSVLNKGSAFSIWLPIKRLDS